MSSLDAAKKNLSRIHECIADIESIKKRIKEIEKESEYFIQDAGIELFEDALERGRSYWIVKIYEEEKRLDNS